MFIYIYIYIVYFCIYTYINVKWIMRNSLRAQCPDLARAQTTD